ncbi:Hypothetical predicted protein [Podarcis lilfordi]|uniref:Uncharacterized protein n=1 Tax=Podarcis lilfordi TaxID=74358 RepID=A0AA35JT51_9SAUR|nr:Hypothetical predicted protein [Podarcis lilfordi]
MSGFEEITWHVPRSAPNCSHFKSQWLAEKDSWWELQCKRIMDAAALSRVQPHWHLLRTVKRVGVLSARSKG